MRALKIQRGWCVAVWMSGVALAMPGLAQPTPGQAAAAAGGGSTSANGGTGGVGLGGTGPGVGMRPDATGGAGSSDGARPPGNGALVGPRAQRQSRELMAEQPGSASIPPGNTGQRALMLDQSRRPAAAASSPMGR